MADRSSPAFRVERWVFAGAGVFLVPWTIVYVTTEYDQAGALLLALAAVALLVIAGFLTYSAQGRPSRPADRSVAPPETLVRHEPEVSVWPLAMAMGAMLLAFGIAFTVWIAAPAALVLLLAIVRYAREIG
ncbi:MAG TPA: cytochrome c oxidase subunit 4 [Acidimicrobiales bacterium]